METFERILQEQGSEIALGLILGIAFLIFLIVAIAIGDRKPPGPKDGP